MKIVSLKNNPELCKRAKLYCLEKWNSVYGSFAKCAEESVKADTLPQTWIELGFEGDREIIGFYQLAEHDGLTRSVSLTPFICTLYVDERVREHGHGEVLLNHAKYEAARLGYEKLYLATDHIGYYEKKGFYEIGLDIFDWGRAAKVYAAYTPSELRLEVYCRNNPVPDRIHLEHLKLKYGSLEENPSAALLFQKMFLSNNGDVKWFSAAAFKEGQLAGWVNFIQNPDNPLNWYLGDLAVIPSQRGKGIAKRLVGRGLDIIRQRASGGEFVCSYIEKGNIASLALHKLFGFVDTKEQYPFWDLNFGEDETTHILFLDGRLTVIPLKNGERWENVSKLYRKNRRAFHGKEISDSEWEKLLSVNDNDEAHFLIYKGLLPAAWLKVNGLSGDSTGWISALAVDPTLHRRGIGAFAVSFAEDFLKLQGKKTACIITTEDNIAAKGLYERCGYVIRENITYTTESGDTEKGFVFEKNIE